MNTDYSCCPCWILKVRAVASVVSILGAMFDTDRLKFIQRKANGRVKRGHGLQGTTGHGKLQRVLSERLSI